MKSPAAPFALIGAICVVIFCGTLTYGVLNYWHTDWPEGWFLPVLYGSETGGGICLIIALLIGVLR